jgi:transcriptional regulator GlxA family with amidase domain
MLKLASARSIRTA